MLAVLRHALAGMTAALRAEAKPAVDLLGIVIPEVPAEIPVIHFSDALAIAGAPADEPDLAPAHERAIGGWEAETRGSEFIAVEGFPMSKCPSTPTRSPATNAGPTASTCSSAARNW